MAAPAALGQRPAWRVNKSVNSLLVAAAAAARAAAAAAAAAARRRRRRPPVQLKLIQSGHKVHQAVRSDTLGPATRSK